MRKEPYHHVIVRHIDPDGRRCRADAPGAVKQRETTQTYYGELLPLKGTRPERVSLETADQGAAWIRLKELRRQRARELEGLADPILAGARKPIEEHLADWHAAVLAAGTSEKHADLMRSRVQALAGLAGWSRLGEMTPESATLALARLQQERVGNMPARYQGRGAQTRNHYLSHARQFIRWCVANDRLDRDRLARVARVGIETDRRHDRRSPTDDEVRRLLDHLTGVGARIRVGTTGPQRALAYQTAMVTGFRGGEIRSLDWTSFDLDAASVSVRASYSKRRRKDCLPLPGWLVVELRTWQKAGGELWRAFPVDWPGRPLKEDLAAAGVPYEVAGPDGPLYFDFHALRHWYVSELAAQPGISPKTLLALARHSTAQLSLKVYAHARQSDLEQAVDRLPVPGQSGRSG